MLLKNRVAIVTGASKGIGKSIALGMAKEGAHLIVNYNTDREGAEKVAREIKKYGQEAVAIQADISRGEAVKNMVKLAKEKFARIDILVNNAGLMLEKYLFRLSDEEWQRCMDININGAYFCSRACLLQMLRQQYGKIINITSLSGVIGNAGHTAYGASKAALIGFTKSLAKEVARKNINVNAIAPGYIGTGMSRNFIRQDKGLLDKIIPAGRIGKAEEVAQLAVFLASEQAGYIHGQVINIDGGITL